MKNWKTTLIGAALAGLSFIAIYQQNGGNLADWKQWFIPALLAVFGYLAKDAGITGTMKLAALSLLLLPACGTTPADEKTFIGITSAGWLNVGKSAAVAAVPAALHERQKTAAKNPRNIQP